MNKKLITSLMVGTILSGSVFAIDPVDQFFGNTTQVPPIVQFSMRMGSLIAGQEALSRRIDDNHQEIKSQLSTYQAHNNQRFDKMDQRFDKMDQRFDKMDQRFDKMDQRFDKMDQRFDSMQKETNQRFDGIDKKLNELIQLLTHNRHETDQKFIEGYFNLTKVAEQTSTRLAVATYQGYTNLTKVADQCYANLTIVATESHKNLTKVEKDLTLSASTIEANHTARLEKLESYWSPDLYQTILTNPLLYGGLISLSLAAKSTSMMPAALLPYASWGLYGTAGTCFYQVGWNYLSPSTPEHTRALLTGGLLMGIGSLILAVQKHEAHIAPHITPSAFGAGLAGLMATGVISYGLKASFDLFIAWVK